MFQVHGHCKQISVLIKGLSWKYHSLYINIIKVITIVTCIIFGQSKKVACEMKKQTIKLENSDFHSVFVCMSSKAYTDWPLVHFSTAC